MTDRPRYTDVGEVILGVDSKGYVHLPIDVTDGFGVSTSVLGVYPPKQIQGDYTRDSHQLLSAFIQSSFIGGGQIQTAQEATDIERFWWSTLETRHPRTLCLPALTTMVAGPNESSARVLGDYNNATLASYGTELRLVESGSATGGATLNGTPVNKGVAFAGTGSTRFFIPLGASGIDIWDGATVTHDGTILAASIELFDEKLYVIETDGDIHYTVDGSTWTSGGVSLDASYTPRHLVSFYDRADQPCLHVVTERDVWAVNVDGPAMYKTQVQYPAHPDQGLASTVWRTDLYVSVGAGMHRYTGSVIAANGIDRDDGLPEEWKARFQDITGAYNGIYCLMRGVPSPTNDDAELYELDLGAGGEDFYVNEASGTSFVCVWDGFGWHYLWGAEASGEPTSIFISGAGGGYRLWWGFAGNLYYQDLPIIFQNPKQISTSSYAPSGFLETPWVDMNMTGSRKILASIEIDTLQCDSLNYADVYYETDDASTVSGTSGLIWLGMINTNGHHVFRFGENGLLPDDTTTRYDGQGFERIRLRFELNRDPDDVSKTPIMESYAISFMKRMGNLRAWEFIVDLGYDGEYKGRGKDELRQYLEACVDDEVFMPFCHQDKWYSVKVSGVSGTDMSGMPLDGSRRINVVESFDL
jgi:hypothetical protein